jgi:hypothetical protein
MVSLERRRSIRIDVEILINYDKETPGRTKNICEQGCCVEINRYFPPGTYLKIMFPLQEPDEIMAIGNVMWSHQNENKNYDVGIEFWYIEEEDRIKIRKYISNKVNSGEKSLYMIDTCK